MPLVAKPIGDYEVEGCMLTSAKDMANYALTRLLLVLV